MCLSRKRGSAAMLAREQHFILGIIVLMLALEFVQIVKAELVPKHRSLHTRA